MKIILKSASISTALLAAICWASVSHAAVVKIAGERAGHWDASFMLNYVSGEELSDGLAQGKTDANMGWGIGIHYNFNEHWNLGFDMAFNNPDYEIQVFDENDMEFKFVDHTANRFDGQLNAQYNLFSGPITPYVQAGIGWTYMDSNIVKSLSTYCGGGYYYYPYCRTYANTFDDNAFSYNLGVGLRWDITDVVFIKAAFIQQWVDSEGDPSPRTGRAEVGMMF